MDQKNVLDETPYELIDMFVNPLVDGLVFLGGEPTIYGKTLLEVAQYAKSRYNLDIKLFTNGTKPDIVLEGLERGLLDFVSIDYKTIDNASNTINTDILGISFQEYHQNLISLLERISRLGFSSKVEIRTTQFKEMSDAELNEIRETCSNLGLRHISQPDMLDSYQTSGMLEGENNITGGV
jgi:pyruvate-formate lyase-activating enzyme